MECRHRTRIGVCQFLLEYAESHGLDAKQAVAWLDSLADYAQLDALVSISPKDHRRH